MLVHHRRLFIHAPQGFFADLCLYPIYKLSVAVNAALTIKPLKMKKKKSTAALLLPLLFIMGMLACEKKEPVNSTTPAYKIKASEKLSIPAEIELPINSPFGNARVATFYATGVQKYKAQQKAGSETGVYEWVFVAPLADLYDVTNKKIGIHGAGPYWTISAADSIFAQQFTPAKTATPDASSIPWLLLMPKTGTTPTGIFSNVIYIQRIATTGGKAPAAAPTSANQTADVPYTAVYRFSKKN